MTTRVTLERTAAVHAPARLLWDYVTDWSRHGEWIPLTRVDCVVGGARAVGGTFRAWSGIGPIGFWDPMTVVDWQEHEDGSGHVAVVHSGRVVRGNAEITVTAVGPDRSELRWVERLLLGRAAALGWRLGSGLVNKGIERALRRMAAIVEGRA